MILNEKIHFDIIAFIILVKIRVYICINKNLSVDNHSRYLF